MKIMENPFLRSIWRAKARNGMMWPCAMKGNITTTCSDLDLDDDDDDDDDLIFSPILDQYYYYLAIKLRVDTTTTK